MYAPSAPANVSREVIQRGSRELVSVLGEGESMTFARKGTRYVLELELGD